jgi:hypothetical protein
MPLTDVAIRQAKPGPKATKLSDEKGMFLLITPAGGKLWRFKYRFEGKEKLLAIGAYPAVSLSDARKRREDARALLAKGKDPSREKQRDKNRKRMEAADTFKAIAAEYCAKRRRDGEKGWAPATATRSEYLLSLLNGTIGSLPISDIEPADILSAIRKIENKGNLESARRTLQLSSMVFRYAVATARLRSDPTRDLRGALTAPKVTHYGAITDAAKVGDLLRAIDGYEGSGITKFALQLAPHVFVRPGEVRYAEWADIDLDQALWVIPAGKTKMRKAHHVPLPPLHRMKLPWVVPSFPSCAQLPDKGEPTKRMIHSDGSMEWGFTRPSQSLAGWQCGYTRSNATAFIARADCDHGRPDGQRWGPRVIHVTDAR